MSNANASAFPLVETEHNKGSHSPDWFSVHSVPGTGLSKREYFAAMAMQGLRADQNGFDSEQIARIAVSDADALLAELAKAQP